MWGELMCQFVNERQHGFSHSGQYRCINEINVVQQVWRTAIKIDQIMNSNPIPVRRRRVPFPTGDTPT
jgi:hypothetical protein